MGKTRHAAEIALKEAEQQKLESAKARALQEAGDIMERLNMSFQSWMQVSLRRNFLRRSI